MSDVLTIGSLCSGYEGLGLAVHAVLGGQFAWVADNDPDASKVLAARFPAVPNLGDITGADWGAVPPVDILTAGFPCTDVSCAGARAGLRAGTRSGVWSYVAKAIAALRPSLVLLENVRGLHSAGADSNMEFCPWCMGEAGDESALRASGAVLGDLAGLGFDAEWATLPASEAGAPHRRERVFVLAWPTADAGGERRFRWPGIGGTWRHAAVWQQAGSDGGDSGCAPAEDSDCSAWRKRRFAAPGQEESRGPRADAGGPGGAPAADAECGRRGGAATRHGAGTGRASRCWAG